MASNRFKNLALNNPLNRFQGLDDSQNKPATPVAPVTSTVQQPVQAPNSMAPYKSNVPFAGQAISAVDPNTVPLKKEEPSIWTRIAKTVLPKGIEDYFGLNDNEPLTPREQVMQHEDAVQNYYRQKRKEENIAKVDKPVEAYTPPTTFGEKLKETKEYGNYAKNVWTGFIKPAIGTVAEQAGVQLDSPKLREWGEQFTDRVMEEEKRRASAQSMADVPGIFEGGLKDPRYFSKTITQAIGFFTAVLGTSVAVTAATKNPAAGAAAGYGVGAALESSGAYQEMIDKGVSPEDANTAAQIYGTAASMIENATGLRPAGGTKAMVQDFAIDAAKNGGVKNFFKKWAQEGILEEGSQQLVQNIVTKSVYKDQKLLENVAESIVGGTVGALPLTGGGAVIGNYQNRKATQNIVNQDLAPQTTVRAQENIPENEYQTLYHVTTPEAAAEINKTGVPKIDGDQAFYAWRTREEAERWAAISGDKNVIVEVQAKPWNITEAKERQATVRRPDGSLMYDVVFSPLDFKPKTQEITKSDVAEEGPTTFYSGARGQVTPVNLDLSNAMVVTLKGDQKQLTNSKSYVEADQKLFDEYGSQYEWIKLEHPEMPNKATEYYNLGERKWYSKDPAVAQAYASQNRELKYQETEGKGPGYRKFSDFVDQMVENQTILPEEAPILKTLFENTSDDFLNLLNYQESARLRRSLGSFYVRSSAITGPFPESNKLKMQKGMTTRTDWVASQTFTHEFGHAGWYLILNDKERAEVKSIYNSLSKAQQRAVFEHNPNHKYYATNVEEFWAQSFSDYLMENKVSADKMEPLLKRMAKRFYDAMKKLILRGENKAIAPMKPLFEKVLSGEADGPLADFVNEEPASTKKELMAMVQKPEAQRKTKEVPAEEFAKTFEGSLFATDPGEKSEIDMALEGYVPPIESEKAPSLQQQILTAKAEFDAQERSNENPPDPVDFPQQVEAVRAGVKSSPILQNIPEYKDIANVKVQFRDLFRNTRQVFGKDAPYAEAILLDPFQEAKGRNINFLINETDELAAAVPFGKDSKESKYIQRYGEGKTSEKELVDKFGKEKADQIIAADTFFRAKYDEMLNKLNQVEQLIYPNSPYKWTPKKKNYYRHFFETSNEFSRLQNILENPVRIDPLLVGISETTKPKSKWASFKQRRTGTETKEDAVGGYLDYLKSVSYAINIDPQIGRFREFSDILKRATGKTKNLNNYIQSLENISNELSGKTPMLDRVVMEHIPGGRTGLAALSWLNRRVKANTILGNVKSSLAQILNVPQGLATAGPINSAKGAAKAMAGVLVENKAMKQSKFIKERFFRGFNQFDKGVLKNAKKFAVWMVGALDEAGTKIIWNGQYEKARNLGIEDPIKYADNKTRDLVAGRGIGEKPTIQNSDVYQLLAPFQYEMTNIWWIMEDIAKGDDELKKKAGQFMMLWIYMWLTNEVFEKVTGGRPLFDPIEAVKDGIEEIEAENNLEGWTKAGGRLFGEGVSNLPGGQFLGTAYPEYGATIAGVDLPTRKEFFGSGDPTRFGEGLLSTKALSDPVFKVLPSYGGGQLKKLFQGLETVNQGKSTTKSGQFQYKVDDSFRNYLQAILFGKYALPEAVEYYEEKEAPKGSGAGGNRFKGL